MQGFQISVLQFYNGFWYPSVSSFYWIIQLAGSAPGIFLQLWRILLEILFNFIALAMGFSKSDISHNETYVSSTCSGRKCIQNYMGGWSHGEFVESIDLVYSLVGSWTLAGDLDDILAAVAWLFAAFIVHCVTCGQQLSAMYR